MFAGSLPKCLLAATSGHKCPFENIKNTFKKHIKITVYTYCSNLLLPNQGNCTACTQSRIL